MKVLVDQLLAYDGFMTLIPQQDIVVTKPPYQPGLHPYDAAAQNLKEVLEQYPPCKIVSLSVTTALGTPIFTAVVETI